MNLALLCRCANVKRKIFDHLSCCTDESAVELLFDMSVKHYSFGKSDCPELSTAERPLSFMFLFKKAHNKYGA
jgi:hypothetical protein